MCACHCDIDDGAIVNLSMCHRGSWPARQYVLTADLQCTCKLLHSCPMLVQHCVGLSVCLCVGLYVCPCVGS